MLYFMYLQKEKSRREIEDLAQKYNVEELRKRLCHRMEFGTAGMLKLQAETMVVRLLSKFCKFLDSHNSAFTNIMWLNTLYAHPY